MGYTHYWNNYKRIPQDKWDAIMRDVKKVFVYADDMEHVRLRYEDDSEAPPEITNEHIRFNGFGDEGYETFYFNREAKGFCKTARHKYDVVVVAVLCVISFYASDEVNLGSDGFTEDWADGLMLARDATGIDSIEFPTEIEVYDDGYEDDHDYEDDEGI